MLKSYSEDMRNLGVPVQNILTNITNLQRLDLESKERLRNERQSTAAKTFIDSLGEEYASLYAASGDFDSVYTQYLDNTRQSNIATLAQQLDPSISDDLASNMTSSDLVNLYESKKEDKGAQKWAKWQGTNPEINDSNRQQAIEAAVAAHGKNAPKIVADLEAQQIKNKAEKEGDKSVPVLITMKSNSAFVDPISGGKTQLTTKSLPVDAQGKLSVDAKNWLEAHAQTAMVQDTGETWNTSTPVNVGGGGTPSGQTNKTTSSVTLGNLAPELITNLSNLELKVGIILMPSVVEKYTDYLDVIDKSIDSYSSKKKTQKQLAEKYKDTPVEEIPEEALIVLFSDTPIDSIPEQIRPRVVNAAVALEAKRLGPVPEDEQSKFAEQVQSREPLTGGRFIPGMANYYGVPGLVPYTKTSKAQRIGIEEGITDSARTIAQAASNLVGSQANFKKDFSEEFRNRVEIAREGAMTDYITGLAAGGTLDPVTGGVTTAATGAGGMMLKNAPLLGVLLGGTAAGASTGALIPTYPEFGDSRLKNTGVGAAIGGGITAIPVGGAKGCSSNCSFSS